MSGADAGIQLFQGVSKPLDSGFHLSARHRQAGVTTFYEAIMIDTHRKRPSGPEQVNQQSNGRTR
ncbi:MAG: hypothetical protein FJ117_18405 [Deltaproteobacteria bacterium]|nr:hypothetical protein [Deltaproteobacteria bacterium]